MTNGLKQRIGCAVYAVCILSFFAWLLYSTLYIPMRMDYTVQVEFRDLPNDDKELQQWLLVQPGVNSGSVHREGKRIDAAWRNNHEFYWRPITLNLRDAFEKFGYKGIVSHYESKKNPDEVSD